MVPPAVGGGAIYTTLLCNHLLKLERNIDIRVVTEQYPGTPRLEEREGKRLVIERLLPYRAGRSSKPVSSYLNYVLAQLSFFRFAKSLKMRQPDICLVHSSFLNNPNLLLAALTLMRSASKGTHFVLDVRDPLVPCLSETARSFFAAAIYCSKRLESVVRKQGGVRMRSVYLPMPIEVHAPTDEEISRIQKKHGLSDVKYILCANNLSKEKNTGLLVEAFTELSLFFPAVRLVLAGRERYSTSQLEEGRRQRSIIVLGPIPQNEVLCLMSAAALVVNPSTVESPSRSAFEAIALKAEVLLPPHVPEFDGLPRDFIADTTSASTLASQMIGALKKKRGTPKYDLHQHHPKIVAASYRKLFFSLSNKFPENAA